MRTALNLDDKLIRDLMAVTKAKTEAIHQALSEFVRRKTLQGLKALSGKIHLDLDWRQLEEEELKAQEARERVWRGHC